MDIQLTPGEQARFRETISRVEEIREFICGRSPANSDVASWFAYLSVIKALQGNANNDLSFLACLLAKKYLVERHGELSFDAAAKAQGASGLDIDVRTTTGQRIIGEVKTVEPYQLKDFGAQEKASFQADFAKLRSAAATFKYLFVTSKRAHEVLTRKHRNDLTGITLVLLDA